MEKSEIYNLIDFKLIGNWRKEIERNDECGYGTEMLNDEQIINETLNENQKRLLNNYALSINNYLDYIYYEICIKVLNFGIKAGLELQAAFDKD